MLKAFGAHIFFDDQRAHAEAAATLVPAAQVLWSEEDLPPAQPRQVPVVVAGRGHKRAKRSRQTGLPRASYSA